MLRSSPACSHWRSARRVGNHTGTVPSETCGSNNMPSITYSCLAAAHIVSLMVGRHRCFLSVTGCASETHKAHLPTHTPTLTPSTLQDLLLCSTSGPLQSPLVTFIPLFPSSPLSPGLSSSGRLPGCKESMRGKDRPWLYSLNTVGAVWQAWLRGD